MKISVRNGMSAEGDVKTFTVSQRHFYTLYADTMTVRRFFVFICSIYYTYNYTYVHCEFQFIHNGLYNKYKYIYLYVHEIKGLGWTHNNRIVKYPYTPRIHAHRLDTSSQQYLLQISNVLLICVILSEYCATR